MSVKKESEHYSDWISNFSSHSRQRLKTNNFTFYAFSFLFFFTSRLLSLQFIFLWFDLWNEEKYLWCVSQTIAKRELEGRKMLWCRFAYFTWLIFAIGRNWRQLTAKAFPNTMADIDFYVADNLISSPPSTVILPSPIQFFNPFLYLFLFSSLKISQNKSTIDERFPLDLCQRQSQHKNCCWLLLPLVSTHHQNVS